VIDQGIHFINDAIKYLTNHFIFRRINSIVYYPQGNGQVEFVKQGFWNLINQIG
jgi:hypothetical protein